jgi:putative flippase GtrA
MATKAEKRRELLGQLIRYAVNGVIVTSLYSGIFILLDSTTHAPVQLCNVAGFLVAVVVGYFLHSTFTFRNQGDRGLRAQIRYFVAALPSYAVNAFWTWLFASALGWPHWTVQLPVWFVTPFMIFAINRWWVFK